MTTAGAIYEYPIPTAGSGPTGIAAGADGNLWFTEGSANKIGRITTAGSFTEFPVPTPGSGLSDIAAGPDGNLWFTEASANKIGRITTSGPVATPTPTSTPTRTRTPTLTPTATSTPSTPTRTPTPAFQVLGIVPASGPASGGTAVSITGTGFLPGATLTIGGVMGESIVVVGSSEIDAATPALGAGTLNDVAVANPASATQASLSAALARGWLADFLDVPQDDIFHDFVETIFRRAVTAGYGNGNYGRDDSISRAQMAVLLLKGKFGSSHIPPPATGTVFNDVHVGDFGDAWIEELAGLQVTVGCGDGNYCPNDSVTRAEMAVFLLKSEHGSTYPPPGCARIFDDVPCPSTVDFPYSDWIEQFDAEGITGGCAPAPPGGLPEYCPDRPNTRGEMAVFLVKTFGLELNGP